MNSKSIPQSADFPGDESYVYDVSTDRNPGIIVNPNADNDELLSGAIHRLDNALGILFLALDRANDLGDRRLEGAVVAMGRLCSEARVLNLSVIERGASKVASRTTSKR